MAKKLLLLVCILISPMLLAQDIDRTMVKGKIHVPSGEDSEGISVYNISSQKGTITEADGSFNIEVAENDRVQIFALQYQTFTVVVDKGIVEKKQMNIVMNPAINQLDEVVVRPYDLSGNIRADVKKIPTYYASEDWDLSYKALEYGYGFERDPQSAIEGNAAEEALNSHYLKHGVDVIAILGGVSRLLFPKGKKISLVEKSQANQLVSNNMQQRFSRVFIEDNFNIPEEKAVDFLYFAQEHGLDQDLLKPENEMRLMQFLKEKSKEYKERQ